LLQALQQREESVRNGKLTTIIFIRDKNAKGQEVSGYIDYGHRQVASAVTAFSLSYTCIAWLMEHDEQTPIMLLL
jgi:hypothetical protein